jgi:hypothetical protein
MKLIERVGNIHLHTTYSDGSGDYAAVAAAARRAGLDFLVVTDHNTYPAHEAGWRNGVLTLVGQELHDPAAPHQNHYLALNAGEDVAPLAADTAALVAGVRARGGLGFIAHPYEHSGAYSGETEIDWRAWDLRGFAGIEIWNYMSEFKSYATTPLVALYRAFSRGWPFAVPSQKPWPAGTPSSPRRRSSPRANAMSWPSAARMATPRSTAWAPCASASFPTHTCSAPSTRTCS